MVGSEFLNKDELGFEEWAVTPSKEDITPDSIKEEQMRNEFRSQLQHEPGAVVVTHNDADGLGCAALMRKAEGSETAVIPVSYTGPYTLIDALVDISEVAHFCTIYITDLGADDASIVGALSQIDQPVYWYDHHQWDSELKELISDTGTEVVVDEDECATSLVERELEYDFPEYMQELAEVTKDIDLWIRDDPRSERLGVMARALDDEVYINSVKVDGVDHSETVEVQIDKWLENSEELEDYAVEQCGNQVVGGYDVGITYIRGGRSSTIGNRLSEEGDKDIAVVLNPTSCHIYSHSNREVFTECHEVARLLGGGGHPTASGFPVPVDTFTELAEYWHLQRPVKEKIESAISEVVGE